MFDFPMNSMYSDIFFARSEMPMKAKVRSTTGPMAEKDFV
jgi:hypothetical protein